MKDQSTPIYKIIEKDLRVAILNGTFKQGDMVPSETELCAKYGVTRMTVRQAINNLLVDGYIYRHKGRGTFVTFNKTEMDQNKPMFSFYREMKGIDAPIETFVLSFNVIEADEIVAARLQLNVDSEIYYVERIRQSANIPLVYERLYLPKNMYHHLDKSVFEKSFHEYLENVENFKIKNCVRSIEARALQQKVADILHQSVGEPSLYMCSITCLDNGRVCVYTRQYFHANYFRFTHNFEK